MAWYGYGKKLTEYQHGIVNEPSLSVPGRIGRVSITGDDHDHPDQSNISTIGLEPAAVREGAAIKSLCLHCLVEEDIGSRHDDISNHTSGSDKVDKPVEHHLRAAAALQEGKAGEDHCNSEGETRHAGHRTLLEGECQDFGRTAHESHTVQASGGSISVGVASAEN